MPRIARFVAPGVAHHITQRGTARQLVFRTRSDYRVYLNLLRDQATFTGVSVLSYCLMPNHVHLIAVPPREDELAVMLRRVHGRYAQYFNARRGRCGHLWQNRFYSCPMGPGHLWTAIRYVESNPVRAGLTVEPAGYEWSSAEAHLTGQDRFRVADINFHRESGGIETWMRLFGIPESETDYVALRKATHSGQPFGDDAFAEDVRAARKAIPARTNQGKAQAIGEETLAAAR